MLSEHEYSILNEYKLAEKHCIQLRKQLYLMELFSIICHTEKQNAGKINISFHIERNSQFNKKTSSIKESEFILNSDKIDISFIDRNANNNTATGSYILKQKLDSILRNGLNKAPELNYLIENPVLNVDNLENFFLFLQTAYDLPSDFHYKWEKQKESPVVKLFGIENPLYFTRKDLNQNGQQVVDEYQLEIPRQKINFNVIALINIIKKIGKSPVEFIFKYEDNKAENFRMLTEIKEYDNENHSFKIWSDKKNNIEVFSILGGIMNDLGLFDKEKSIATMSSENIHLFPDSLKTSHMSVKRSIFMDNPEQEDLKMENAVLNSLIDIEARKSNQQLNAKSHKARI